MTVWMATLIMSIAAQKRKHLPEICYICATSRDYDCYGFTALSMHKSGRMTQALFLLACPLTIRR